MPATKKNRTTLYAHKPRPFVVRHAHEVHKAKLATGSGFQQFNIKLALWIQEHVGSMNCFYIFNVLSLVIILGALGVFGDFSKFVVLLGAIVSSYWLQLVLLPSIQVGQNIQGQHAAIQSDEQFKATMNTLHDAEQMTAHLDKQDDLILQILQRLTTPPPASEPYLTAMTQPMETMRAPMNARKS